MTEQAPFKEFESFFQRCDDLQSRIYRHIETKLDDADKLLFESLLQMVDWWNYEGHEKAAIVLAECEKRIADIRQFDPKLRYQADRIMTLEAELADERAKQPFAEAGADDYDLAENLRRALSLNDKLASEVEFWKAKILTNLPPSLEPEVRKEEADYRESTSSQDRSPGTDVQALEPGVGQSESDPSRAPESPVPDGRNTCGAAASALSTDGKSPSSDPVKKITNAEWFAMSGPERRAKIVAAMEKGARTSRQIGDVTGFHSTDVSSCLQTMERSGAIVRAKARDPRDYRSANEFVLAKDWDGEAPAPPRSNGDSKHAKQLAVIEANPVPPNSEMVAGRCLTAQPAQMEAKDADRLVAFIRCAASGGSVDDCQATTGFTEDQISEMLLRFAAEINLVSGFKSPVTVQAYLDCARKDLMETGRLKREK